jgi:hypothetical protein
MVAKYFGLAKKLYQEDIIWALRAHGNRPIDGRSGAWFLPRPFQALGTAEERFKGQARDSPSSNAFSTFCVMPQDFRDVDPRELRVEVIGKLPKAFAAEPKIGDLLP